MRRCHICLRPCCAVVCNRKPCWSAGGILAGAGFSRWEFWSEAKRVSIRQHFEGVAMRECEGDR